MAKIIIKDDQGKDSSTFIANKDESIGSQAQDAGSPIPFSCGVGACRTCVCKVEKGMEFINPEAISPQHIEVEDGEILTCIAGLKEDTPEDAEIIMQAENI